MSTQREVNVRELRNHGGQVLDRVVRGETLVVTKAGVAIAELRPLPSGRCGPAELIARAQRLPVVDPDRLRDDVDRVVDQTL